jgi:aspartyl protease family protein
MLACIWPAALVVCLAPALADDAEAVLKTKGLKKIANTYVLDEEADILKAMSASQRAQKEHAQAVAALKAAEQDLMKVRNMIPELTQHRLQLSQQMQNTPRNSPQYNDLVLMYNNATDQLNLYQGRVGETKATQNLREQVARKREVLVQGLVELQPRLEGLDRHYEELAADPEVVKAIEDLNKAAKVKVKLGPSSGFVANHKVFDKVAASLLSDVVPLRPEGGVNMIDVTLNGKLTRAMVLDTGASWVTLPADLAEQAGVPFGPDSPKVKITIADGRTFEAFHAYLASVRVGKFTAEQVECIVLPPEYKTAPALLGTSFLRSFIFRVNPDSRGLSLSKVAEAPGADAQPTRSGRTGTAKKK